MKRLVDGPDTRIINLDDAADRLAAERDSDGFAAQHPRGVLGIDEIQRVPALLTSLKAVVDVDRRPGRFEDEPPHRAFKKVARYAKRKCAIYDYDFAYRATNCAVRRHPNRGTFYLFLLVTPDPWTKAKMTVRPAKT